MRGAVKVAGTCRWRSTMDFSPADDKSVAPPHDDKSVVAPLGEPDALRHGLRLILGGQRLAHFDQG